MKKNSKTLEIYTDGGCKLDTKHDNGKWTGPGSNAYVLVVDGVSHISGSQFVKSTTNNRMELQAVINALNFCITFIQLKPQILGKSHNIKIFSDSQYVCKGISEWITNWKKRDWKTAAGKSVENQDLWKQLDNVNSFVSGTLTDSTEFVWVKGHADNEFNNLVDQLCTDCINENKNNE